MRREISDIISLELPDMKEMNCFTNSRWSGSEILPTQGALHLSMCASRHGRPAALAFLKTPEVQLRTGNTRNK